MVIADAITKVIGTINTTRKFLSPHIVTLFEIIDEKYERLRILYPSLPELPIKSTLSPDIFLAGFFFSFTFLFFSLCCSSSSKKKLQTNSKKKKSNKLQIGAIYTNGTNGTANQSNGHQEHHNDSTQKRTIPGIGERSTGIGSGAGGGGTSSNNFLNSDNKQNPHNTPLKQLLKSKRNELNLLQQKGKANLNNRERRTYKKLESAIEDMAIAKVNPSTGMCLNPSSLDEHFGIIEPQDKKEISSKNIKDEEQQEEDKPVFGASVTEIQQKLGISVEQATAAMIAQSVHAEANAEANVGNEEEWATAGGGKKKNKNKAPVGWETVKKKK